MPQRSQERDFLEFTASSYEYCYANPVRFTDPNGEQPGFKIGYVGTQRATTATAVNVTPAAPPKFPWSEAKQGSQLEGSGYHRHVAGGWVPANATMHGSASTAAMAKQGLHSAAGADSIDRVMNNRIQNAKMNAAAETFAQQAPELQRMQNSAWVAMRFGYEGSQVKGVLSAISEYSQGNYGAAAVTAAMAMAPFVRFGGGKGAFNEASFAYSDARRSSIPGAYGEVSAYYGGKEIGRYAWGEAGLQLDLNIPDQLQGMGLGSRVFGDAVAETGATTFRATWIESGMYSTGESLNLTQFRQGLSNGLGQGDAAFSTWTGQQAKANGFNNVTVQEYGTGFQAIFTK